MTTQSSKLGGPGLPHPLGQQRFPCGTLCFLHVACDLRESFVHRLHLEWGPGVHMPSGNLTRPAPPVGASARSPCSSGLPRTRVGLVAFGMGFPCELEVKYAGFLPRTKSLPSLLEMQKPFWTVCEWSPKCGGLHW